MGSQENAVQKPIIDYLTMRGYFFWRSNNIPIFRNGHYCTPPPGFRNGVPDIIVFDKSKRKVIDARGRCQMKTPEETFWAIECKAPKGVISKAQLEFMDEVTRRGGRYILARKLEDVTKWM